jgi:hypothetical protein
MEEAEKAGWDLAKKGKTLVRKYKEKSHNIRDDIC